MTSGEDGDVLHGGFSIITERWSLDNADLQIALQLVDDQSSQKFTFYILSDDQKWFLLLICELQIRKNFLNA